MATQSNETDPWVDCPSCYGYGDHGVEEDTGALYACYTCGCSGSVRLSQLSDEERQNLEEEG